MNTQVLQGIIALQEGQDYTLAFVDFICDIKLENNEYHVFIDSYTHKKSYYENVEISFEDIDSTLAYIDSNLLTYKQLKEL